MTYPGPIARNSDTFMNKLSPRRVAAVVSILSAGNFAIGMGAFIVIGIMTPMSVGLDLSKFQAGMVLTVYALAYAIGSPLSVALTGHLSRLQVLSLGLLIFLVGALTAASAESPTVLYAARILAALGAGLYSPVTSVVAMALVQPEVRGKVLAKVFLGFTLAQVIGVPVGSFIGYTYGWQMAFLMVAVLSAICLMGVRVLVPATLTVQVNSLSTLWQTIKNPPVMVAVSFTATYIACNYVVLTFMAPLLETQMGYSRNGVTTLLLFYGLGAVLGNILGGRMTDRIGPYKSIAIACVSQIALLPVYSLLPIPDLALFALTMVWTTFGWSFMVPQQARLIAAAPHSQSVVLALNAAAVYIGASVGASIAGVINELVGLQALGLAGALVAILAMVHLRYSEHLLTRASS